MNNEEKILEILTQIQEEQKQMREEQRQMRDEQQQMRMEQQQMREEQQQMQENIHRINARLDFDVEKRIDAINEGIDAILEAVVPKSRVERLEDDVVILKTAVKMLTQEVSELKKAQ